jgi:hypothetical protein
MDNHDRDRGNPDMTEEQRRHTRHPVESRVFVELAASGIGRSDSGKVAICRTLDVSSGGLRISLEHELRVGSVLQIGVELPETQETLYLAGEVRWCLPNPKTGTGWTAGLALVNASDSDIDRWIELLTRMEK